MKERSKERIAQLLLDELFARLGEDQQVRRMLGDLSALPPDEVVGKLAGDIIEAIMRRRADALAEFGSGTPDPPPDAPVTGPELPDVTEPSAPPEVVPPPEPAQPEEPVVSADESPFWGDLEKAIRGEKTAPAEVTGGAPRGNEEEFTGSLAEADAGELRTAVEFTDEDTVYLHGVTLIPGEERPADLPYMLEEKGIDGRSFAFAFDYEGMRFYLSRVLPNIMNVSKTGVLLLGKQESLEACATHESVLNELRLHGTLLPFAFGTLARGRDDLMGRVDAVRQKLIESLEAIGATRWWVVRLYVLDARIAQLVGKEDLPSSRRGRTVERASYTKTPAYRKFDIKVLERILGKEKRIAESVHEELKNRAERSDIDMIVGLGSGASEDWKKILEASYEVQSDSRTKFFRTVADLQYRHLTIDLMLSVTGDAEPFAFSRP